MAGEVIRFPAHRVKRLPPALEEIAQMEEGCFKFAAILRLCHSGDADLDRKVHKVLDFILEGRPTARPA